MTELTVLTWESSGSQLHLTTIMKLHDDELRTVTGSGAAALMNLAFGQLKEFRE